jgi:hypothetical protein
MGSGIPGRSDDDERQPPQMPAASARRVRELFDRLPGLAGFRVRSDLTVANVSLVGGVKGPAIWRLHVRLMQALVELVECDPGSVELMRGRTFLRLRSTAHELRPRPQDVAADCGQLRAVEEIL